MTELLPPVNVNPYKKFEQSPIFSTAISEARRYVHKWYHWEGADEPHQAAYNGLSKEAKTALNYLCFIGEID